MSSKKNQLDHTGNETKQERLPIHLITKVCVSFEDGDLESPMAAQDFRQSDKSSLDILPKKKKKL